MITRVFLFRHGQTDWNKEGRFQGHTDIPLNSTGVTEANELRSFVEVLAPEMIISSDLQRAIATAEIVNVDLNLPMTLSESLREVNLGEAEGLYTHEVENQMGMDFMNQWRSNDRGSLSVGFPKGETKIQVVSRVFGFLENFLRENSIQRLAVSTHGGVIKRVCHHIAELTHEDVPIKNCCLYEIEFAHKNHQWRFVKKHR